MRFRDLTRKDSGEANEYNEPTRGRPVAIPSRQDPPEVPEAYRKAGEIQRQAEANIAAVLGNVDPALATEVVRRLSVDDRFYPAIRATMEQPALKTVLEEVQKEALRTRLEDLKRK
jgi:hypothetical protein